MQRMKPFIYQKEDWPEFRWEDNQLIKSLGKVRNLQGLLIGKMEALGFELRSEATLKTLTLDVLKTSEIEDEILNPEEVRSSLARRLGMDIEGLLPSDRHVDGIVDMMLDAAQKSKEPLTKDRLFGWHAAMFPGGRSGMYKIIVGDWRDDSTGPMQVVSGAMGKERVHFQAPPSEDVAGEMKRFLDWVNDNQKLDPVIKAGIAHLWFLTIHPFEDGNGRIGRTIADMLLTRGDDLAQRFYSMSAQIKIERKQYYATIEKSQQGTLNITSWLEWFLDCLKNALEAAEVVLSKVLIKHKFWNHNATTVLNARQVLMINKLLDGFDGKLNSSKWAKIGKCSSDTALRDIQDLMAKKILKKEEGGGRNTSYILEEV